MPKKSRDAFAFRRLVDALKNYAGLDVGVLLTYDNRQFCKENGIYNPDLLVEDCLLEYLDGGEIKRVGDEYRPFSQAKQLLALGKARILKLRETCNRLALHNVRLQQIERAIFSKILSDGLNSTLQSKGNRVKETRDCYDWLLQLFTDYEQILWQDWRAVDESFNHLCRKGFGERLRQARVERKLSIEDVARRLRLSRTGYGYYELGQRDLPTPTIYRLAEMLEVSTDWLFGLKD